MKIKLKIKTLILFSLGFLLMVFVLLPKGNIVIARVLDRMDSSYAEVFYQRYLNQNFGNPDFRAQLEYAESLVDGFNRFAIFPGHRGGSGDNRPEDIEEAKELLEEGLNRSKNLEDREHYSIRAYRLLMDLYITSGDMKGFQNLLDMDVGVSQELQELKGVYQSYYEVYFGDLEKAKELLKDLHPAYHMREQQTLLGEIALREGDLDRAKDHINEAGILRSGNLQYFGDTLFGSGAFRLQDYWLETYAKELSGRYTLSGRVTFEGEPMPFVEIYIKESGDQSWNTSGERFVAITDEEGYFESLGLRRGSYSVGLGLDSSRLYNKYYAQMPRDLSDERLILEENHFMELEFTKPIEFTEVTNKNLMREDEEFQLEWNPVPKAAYYEAYYISFINPMKKTGGHGQNPLDTLEGEQRIMDTQGTFTVKEINQRGPEGVITFGDEEMLLGPRGVLRPILPGVEYPLIIKAYDEEGREITSSLALIGDYREVPSFTMEGELTLGEELILDQNYPEAIGYYKEHIKDEEVREEALRTLSLLYHYGWKRGEEDQDQALFFAKEYYNETGNSRHLEMIIGSITLEDLVKNRSMIENFMEMIEEPEDPYYFQQARANLHLIDEDWEQAVTILEGNEHSLSWKVFYLDLLLGDYQSAAKRLQDRRFHVYRMDPLKTEEMLQALSDQGVSDADETRLERLVETLLIEGRDSAEEVYREILPDVESKALRDLLYEIHLNNNWDRDW